MAEYIDIFLDVVGLLFIILWILFSKHEVKGLKNRVNKLDNKVIASHGKFVEKFEGFTKDLDKRLPQKKQGRVPQSAADAMKDAHIKATKPDDTEGEEEFGESSNFN